SISRRFKVAARGTERRGRWVFVTSGAILLIIIGSLIAYHNLDLEHFQSHSERMRKLQADPLVGVPSASAIAGDWPQWRGPNRDGLSLDTGLLSQWPPNGPRVQWEQPIGRGFSAPVIVQGRVYTMAQYADSNGPQSPGSSPVYEAVVCWDAETGKELWRFSY